MSDLDQARRAKIALAALVDGDDRITGIGLAPTPDGGYRLKLNLREPVEGLVTEVDGVPVTTELVGDIQAG